MQAAFHIAGIATYVADQVRNTSRAVAYPHPAHTELAKGTGPCRHCLATFRVGEEERILFTHQPFTDAEALPVPGPVFIHAAGCPRFEGTTFPEPLRALPLAFDGFGARGLVRGQVRVNDGNAEAAITALFGDPEVRYLHVRHGEAGCFVARIDRL